MSKSTLICPSCSSPNLKIIGAFFLSHEGIPVTQGFSLTALQPAAYSITRQILQCDDCNKRTTLEDAEKFSGLNSKATYWEANDKGFMRAVVCPVCSNSSSFTRDVLILTKTTQYVEVEEGRVNVTESSDSEQQDLIVFKYVCTVEDCGGSIVVRSNTYGLVAQNG